MAVVFGSAADVVTEAGLVGIGVLLYQISFSANACNSGTEYLIHGGYFFFFEPNGTRTDRTGCAHAVTSMFVEDDPNSLGSLMYN